MDLLKAEWRRLIVANYEVPDRINVDFKEVYGKEFAFLNSQAPCSVFLAEGSAVRVSNRRKIRIK
ncbi:MAG: hypothetical protein KatS3mg033_0234 [Thermonema sp.]|nr:MAG: hypothetical protein KatS3mg033_0234 [Thermonema sp.]